MLIYGQWLTFFFIYIVMIQNSFAMFDNPFYVKEKEVLANRSGITQHHHQDDIQSIAQDMENIPGVPDQQTSPLSDEIRAITSEVIIPVTMSHLLFPLPVEVRGEGHAHCAHSCCNFGQRLIKTVKGLFCCCGQSSFSDQSISPVQQKQLSLKTVAMHSAVSSFTINSVGPSNPNITSVSSHLSEFVFNPHSRSKRTAVLFRPRVTGTVNSFKEDPMIRPRSTSPFTVSHSLQSTKKLTRIASAPDILFINKNRSDQCIHSKINILSQLNKIADSCEETCVDQVSIHYLLECTLQCIDERLNQYYDQISQVNSQYYSYFNRMFNDGDQTDRSLNEIIQVMFHESLFSKPSLMDICNPPTKEKQNSYLKYQHAITSWLKVIETSGGFIENHSDEWMYELEEQSNIDEKMKTDMQRFICDRFKT